MRSTAVRPLVSRLARLVLLAAVLSLVGALGAVVLTPQTPDTGRTAPDAKPSDAHRDPPGVPAHHAFSFEPVA